MVTPRSSMPRCFISTSSSFLQHPHHRHKHPVIQSFAREADDSPLDLLRHVQPAQLLLALTSFGVALLLADHALQLLLRHVLQPNALHYKIQQDVTSRAARRTWTSDERRLRTDIVSNSLSVSKSETGTQRSEPISGFVHIVQLTFQYKCANSTHSWPSELQWEPASAALVQQSPSEPSQHLGSSPDRPQQQPHQQDYM